MLTSVSALAVPAAASGSAATPASTLPQSPGSLLGGPSVPLSSTALPVVGPASQRTAAPSTSTPASLDVPVAARILVRFTDSATAAQRATVVASVGGFVDQEIAALGLVRIAIPADGSDSYGEGPAIAAFVAKQAGVASAEFDSTVRVEFTPNDPYYATDPYVQLGLWGIRKAQVDKAWDVVRSSPIKIAVIDTGVDPGHPDLVGALLPGRSFLTNLTTGCARVENDDNSHGTHVTGIIAANANNGVGIAGVAFGAKVLPIKALDCDGSGLLSDVAQAIVYATDQGARIMSISLGSGSDTTTLRSAVQYATARNVLVVVAAGNCGTGEPLNPRCSSLNEVSFPAGYTDALAVSATDVDDTRAPFSTQGTYVDLSAPGRRIVSTVPTYGTKVGTLNYAAFSGTSQAAPFVAGIAALVWSRDPSLTAAQVRARLLSSADDLGATGTDDTFGAGRVNALRAVSFTAGGGYGASYGLGDIPRSAIAGGTAAASVLLLNASTFTWRATGPDAVRLTYTWVDQAGTTALSGAPIALPTDVAPGTALAVPFTLSAPAAGGAYTLRVDLLHEGIGLFSTRGVPAAQTTMTVGGRPRYAATYSTAASAAAATATLGVPATLEVTLVNTGTFAWPATGATPVRLSYHWLDAGGRVVVWEGQRTVLPREILPGASVTVPLAYAPPLTVGTYTLRIELVHEGVAWFSDLGVAPRDVTIPVGSGFAATYSVSAPPALLVGGRLLVPVTVRNTGTLTWRPTGPNPIRLAAHVADAAGNTVRWDGERTAFASDVAPGASVTTNLIVAAPLEPGTYRVRTDLVQEGVAWFSGSGVATGDTFVLVLSDFRATLPTGPLAISRVSPLVPVSVTNSSAATWTSGGAAPVALSSHWLDAAGRVLVWDGPRAPLPKAIAPGETVVVPVPLGTVPAGAVHLVIDMVADGLRWFGAGIARPVTITP